MKKLLVGLIAGILFLPLLQGQEIISIFGRVYANPENGPGYFKPLSNALNSGLSAQWLSHKPESRMRFGLQLIGVRIYVPESYRSFDAMYQNRETGATMHATVSTVFGDNEAIEITESNGYTHIFPGGFDYRSVTIGLPQLTVEGLFNSAVSVRFISFGIDEDIGNFSTFGLALEHYLDEYADLERGILSVSGGYERFKAGDIMNANQGFLKTTGGFDWLAFHVYGSIGYQWFRQSVRYEDPFEDPEVQEIDIPADNNLLLQFGAGFQVAIVQAGLEIAPLKPFSVGLRAGLKF